MNRVAAIALTPLSVLYGLGVRIRNDLYRRGIYKSRDVGAPVISIGNLTTGGTGKTPLVEFVASRMAADGWRVCVLTRGYARNSTGRVIVSDGKVVLSDVEQAGDEPFMLAENLQGRAAVICDKNRVAAAEWAGANFGSDLFVLDDAFQHQQIQRTMNVLAVDATSPFGNGKLLPAGQLREPLTQLRRASCIVITRANEAPNVDSLRAQIEQIAGAIPIFTSQLKLADIRPLDPARDAVEVVDHNVALAAFCGIGNPDSFFNLLKSEGYRVTHTRKFRDHHNYDQADIDQVVREASERGAGALVTTNKDAVKLRSFAFGRPCYVAGTSTEINEAETFFRFIHQVIKR